MSRALGVVLLLGYFGASAAEQCAPDTLETCVKQTDASARLACFDKEMQRRHVTAKAPAAPEPATAAPVASTARATATTAVASVAAPPAAAAPKPPDENYGLQGQLLQKKLKEQPAKPPPLQPLAATVKRVLPRPDNEYAFELDNGQVWEQAESKSNMNIKPQDAVTIVPGALGSFFLTDGKHLRLRVHRIK
jgi:hypothetical protein